LPKTKILGIYNRLLLPFIGWVIFCTVLLTIPGDSLPGESWLNIPHLDKYIHIFLFSVMTVLMSRWLLKKGIPYHRDKLYIIVCALIALAYGIAMEYVQKYWIPLRSFDYTDIIADGVGAILGVVITVFYYLKH
jgi:predicted Abi (CAAX) family protease